MKYYALYDESGKLTTFGYTTAKTVVGEITMEEYDALKAVHMAKADYARRMYAGAITAEEVPEEYRADVVAMVEQMQIQPEATNSDIDEALAILRGEVLD